MSELADAKKDRISAAAALRMAKAAKIVWVAKGKKFIKWDLKKDKPSDAEIKKAIVGPSGFLRAPTLRRGGDLFVGFHAEVYQDELG